jgi:hypothetical protein
MLRLCIGWNRIATLLSQALEKHQAPISSKTARRQKHW